MTQTVHTDGPVKKIVTGIPGFDAISMGGLPKGRTTLVTGTAGSSKTIMAVQFLIHGMQKYDEPGVFVTFEETPIDIRRNVGSFGWNLEQYSNEGRLAFVDGSPEPGQSTVETGNYDFSALLARIESAVKKVGAQRVAIDSVSALFSQFADAGVVRRELFRLAAGLKQMGVTSLLTAERLQEYGDIARFGVEEFVADNVIVLRNVLEQERRRRTIEILKYRGSAHQKGEFPFTISPDGIAILPLSAMELTQKSSNVRISSGNEELDRMCSGGYYRDSVILVSGATGTGKTLMVTTFLDNGSKCGEKTLVFAFEESREQLLRNAIGWSIDFRKWEEKGLLKILCQYPETLGLEDHLLWMKKEIENFGPTRVALDSLSALERVSSVKSFREFVIALTAHLKAKETAGLFTATTVSLMGGTSITETHISSITDSIILLRYVELMGEMRRGITVLKMRGSWHDKAIREFEIDDKGMHIGRAFHAVSGILAGTPTRLVLAEQERMGEMFQRK
ncbi:circadian clock protein KaiC [Acidobacteriia bacterium AH_259_A11_L15]|nr:circadian clock protein KaiC [Acidobacteriia bacterium AH_259_A11_L15]